jgi:hypothetical protein
MTETLLRSRHRASLWECFLCFLASTRSSGQISPYVADWTSGSEASSPMALPVDEACPGDHHFAARPAMCILTAHGEPMIELGVIAGVGGVVYHPWRSGRAERSEGMHKRSAEDWGGPCDARSGRPLERISGDDLLRSTLQVASGTVAHQPEAACTGWDFRDKVRRARAVTIPPHSAITLRERRRCER